MLTALLKKLLFRQWIKNIHLQPFWRRLHTVATFAMNYHGGSEIAKSGETWVVSHVVRDALAARSGAVVFDVGANVGDYSLLVAGHLRSATIYAFEPSPRTYAELVTHVAPVPGIVALPLGLSDTDGTVEFFTYAVDGVEDRYLSAIDLRRPTLVLPVELSGSEQVEVRTLDGFCEERGIEAIDFLKMDVEGHELSVLRGAQRMLGRGAISMIQFEFGPANIYSRTYLFDFWELLAAQYDFFRIVPSGIVPIRSYGEHLEVFLTTNYLAVRKPDSPGGSG
jgi:FkbM family methyltransferase